MTRAFGDLALSAAGVVPTPDVAVFPRRSGPPGEPGGGAHGAAAAQQPLQVQHAQQAQRAQQAGRPEELLVVATDGIWDVLSSQEAVEVAAAARSPQQAARQLVLAAQARWAVRSGGQHVDDITVAVAFL